MITENARKELTRKKEVLPPRFFHCSTAMVYPLFKIKTIFTAAAGSATR